MEKGLVLLLFILVVISGCAKQSEPVTPDTLKEIIKDRPEIKEMETQYKQDAIIEIMDRKQFSGEIEEILMSRYGSFENGISWLGSAVVDTALEGKVYLYQVSSEGKVLSTKMEEWTDTGEVLLIEPGPETCHMAPFLSCTNLSVSNGEIKLVLQNDRDKDITIKSIKVSGTSKETVFCALEANKLLKAGSSDVFDIVGCRHKGFENLDLDKRVFLMVTISYMRENSPAIYESLGQIQIKVANLQS